MMTLSPEVIFQDVHVKFSIIDREHVVSRKKRKPVLEQIENKTEWHSTFGKLTLFWKFIKSSQNFGEQFTNKSNQTQFRFEQEIKCLRTNYQQDERGTENFP